MTLREKQSLFAKLAARLILHAYHLGFEVTISHVMRCMDCRVGKTNSNHKIKLAIDLNLFWQGEYLPSTESHKPLGEWWEKQHPLCRWGGRFKDGNHYSLEHNGRK